jgi:hypothetical protein
VKSQSARAGRSCALCGRAEFDREVRSGRSWWLCLAAAMAFIFGRTAPGNGPGVEGRVNPGSRRTQASGVKPLALMTRPEVVADTQRGAPSAMACRAAAPVRPGATTANHTHRTVANAIAVGQIQFVLATLHCCCPRRPRSAMASSTTWWSLRSSLLDQRALPGGLRRLVPDSVLGGLPTLLHEGCRKPPGHPCAV